MPKMPKLTIHSTHWGEKCGNTGWEVRQRKLRYSEQRDLRECRGGIEVAAQAVGPGLAWYKGRLFWRRGICRVGKRQCVRTYTLMLHVCSPLDTSLHAHMQNLFPSHPKRHNLFSGSWIHGNYEVLCVRWENTYSMTPSSLTGCSVDL